MELGYYFIKVKANANVLFRTDVEDRVKHPFTQFDLEWQNYFAQVE